MSVGAIAWAMKMRVGSPTLKAVLIAVGNYADEDGCCWPSQARLARDTELSERAVRTSLAELEKRGILARQERPRRADKTRQSDLIRLVFQCSESMRNVVPHGGPEHAERAASCQETIRNDVPEDLPERGAGPCGTSVQNHAERGAGKPSVEPSDEPSLAGAQPRRPARGAAKAKLPSDFGLTDGRRRLAAAAGIGSDLAAREIVRFRNHYRSDDRSSADWNALWENWCLKAAEIHGLKAPSAAGQGSSAPMIMVLRDSPEGEAWAAHERASCRRLAFFDTDPDTLQPARRMPSRWPPSDPRNSKAA